MTDNKQIDVSGTLAIYTKIASLKRDKSSQLDRFHGQFVVVE